MLFWFKKLLGYVLMPLPMCLGLLTAGVVLLFSARRARLGRALVLTSATLLLLFSNKLISAWLVRPLENRYPSIPEYRADAPLPAVLSECRFIIVLGAGNGNQPGLSALNQLSPSALSRIAEAVRLLRLLPDAKLVLSGPAVKNHPSHAVVLGRAALSLGIDEGRIVFIEKVRDTEDESIAAKNVIGDAPFALVTSAWHMPRSMALFRHAGMEPLACPADYTARSDGQWHWNDLLWDVPSLERSTWAVRERLGYLWIWLRGKT
jgi:uncharacterized SAM-binding protein YcdF (DUF218 family)